MSSKRQKLTNQYNYIVRKNEDTKSSDVAKISKNESDPGRKNLIIIGLHILIY